MRYAPTLTDQKFESILSIELNPRYVLGRMRYAPTLTDQKFGSILSIESKNRIRAGAYAIRPYPDGRRMGKSG